MREMIGEGKGEGIGEESKKKKKERNQQDNVSPYAKLPLPNRPTPSHPNQINDISNIERV